MTTVVAAKVFINHHCHNIQAPTLRHCVNVSRTINFIWEKKNDHMVNYNGSQIKIFSVE